MPQTRRRLSDLHLSMVAEVYMEATTSGERSPNKAIAATWDVPITTAAAWVKTARDRGLLAYPDRGMMTGQQCKGRCSVCCPLPRLRP